MNRMNQPELLQFLDRSTGQLVTEKRSEDWILKIIYGSGPLSFLLRALLRQPVISRLTGLAYERPVKPASLLQFIKQWDIETSEVEKPLPEYPTLNAFFARRLKPAARPIEKNPKRLISPADARVKVFPKLKATRLPVKNGGYTLKALLNDSDLAQRYEGGDIAVFRLAPQDYHRFHFPEGGQAGPARKIAGYLDSVSPIALRQDPHIFCHNQRELVQLDSDGFGRILLLAVGALSVGSILQTYRPGRVERGQEQGYFCFGGSTIVMLLKAGQIAFDADLILNSQNRLETKVKMGTGIGSTI